MPRKQTPWDEFKANPDPLAKPREIKKAVPNGPGLVAIYEEAKTKGTIFGVPVLTVNRNIFVPRSKIIERVEGA